jgi:hypothetical protein
MNKLITVVLSCLLLSSACACSKQPPLEVASESPSDHASGTEACAESAAGTPAHCECIGGYVKGDIGDGKVACAEGEQELERVQQGIEGAVCCKGQ